jgi:hypothetical protein
MECCGQGGNNPEFRDGNHDRTPNSLNLKKFAAGICDPGVIQGRIIEGGMKGLGHAGGVALRPVAVKSQITRCANTAPRQRNRINSKNEPRARSKNPARGRQAPRLHRRHPGPPCRLGLHPFHRLKPIPRILPSSCPAVFQHLRISDSTPKILITPEPDKPDKRNGC